MTAIIGGVLLKKKLSVRTINIAGGLVFIAVGIWMIFDIPEAMKSQSFYKLNCDYKLTLFLT